MVARPAARIFDPTIHLLPWLLQHGPPATNKPVMIGAQLAWKGAPAGAGGSLKEAKDASNERIRKATAACHMAGDTPQAKAALEALKVKEQAEMTKKVLDAAASGASIHDCISIAPIPVGIPHGPGIVINGSKTVLVNGLPVCRMGDEILEAFGPKNFIAMGMPNVIVGDSPNTSILDLLAALVKALEKLALSALQLARTIAGLIKAMTDAVIAAFIRGLQTIAQVARKAVQAVLQGAARASKGALAIARAVAHGVKEAVDGIAKAVKSGGHSDAANSIAGNLEQAAEAFNQGVDQAAEDARKAAEKAIQDRRDAALRKAERIKNKGEDAWDKGMRKLDNASQDDGIVGEAARKAREEAERLARTKRGAEKLAERGVDEAQNARDRAREAKQAAKDEADDLKKETARKLHDLVDGLSDGLTNATATEDEGAAHAH